MKTPKAQQFLELTFQLLSAGQLKEAQRACRKAVQARPDLPEGHLLLSEIHHQSGDAAKARESATRALRLRPQWSEAYVALGNAEALAENLSAAEGHFRSAIAAGSPGAGVHANLGHVLRRQGRLEDARAAYELALSREPNALPLHLYAATALADLGRSDEAAARYRRALELDERSSDTREQLLRVLHGARRFAEMEPVARDGMAIHPEAIVYPHQLGIALWWQGRHDEALAAFERIERMAPDRAAAAYQEAKLDQATCLLTLGRLREGWQAYAQRPSRTAWRERFPRILDDPRRIAGLRQPTHIEVIGEQGLGDELFFLRFARRLRESGHRLSGRFDRRLLPLLGGVFDRLVPFDALESVGADATVLSADLPLGCEQDSAPPLVLPVDPVRRAKFDAQMRQFGPPPYIGVTWQAGALPDERKDAGAFYLVKEVPPELLGGALRPLGATVISMQRRPSAEAQRRFTEALGRPVLDLSAVNDDLQDALAVLSLLDDYVGVSNTNTHLRAGCPGKRARVLVHFNPEWRWGLGAGHSSWFPDFSVCRESARDGWPPALETLARDLQEPLLHSSIRVG